LTTFSLTALVLGFGVISSLRGLLELQAAEGELSGPFVERMTQEYITQSLVAGVAAVLLSLSAAFAYFGIAGPIHGVRTYFRGLSAGRWDSQCCLRERDSLHDLKDSVNEALDGMRALLRDQHAALSSARHLLRETSQDETKAAELLGQIDAVATEFDHRLGNADTEQAEPDVSSVPATENVTT
jgi:methyl-accepting chemotaxis protein